MGTGEWRRMVSRISGILPPVERSITVSAPCWMAMCSLRSSSSMLEVTAELPMLALTLHFVAMPMPMGSSSGWLMFAGMMRRPAAISSRTSSAEMLSRRATYSISSVILLRRAKCICDMLESRVRAASALRFTIHSARGWRISRVAFCDRPLVVMVPPGRRRSLLACWVCSMMRVYVDSNYKLMCRKSVLLLLICLGCSLAIDLEQAYAEQEPKRANRRRGRDYSSRDWRPGGQRSARQQELLRDHSGTGRDGIEGLYAQPARGGQCAAGVYPKQRDQCPVRSGG